MIKQLKVSRVLSFSGYQKVTPDTTVSSLFSRLKSSHDAVFVFDNDRFLGLVNLYHSFLKKKLPAQAKVFACLYHPPRIFPNTLVSEAVRLMIESRVYKLPVLDEQEKFIGVITASKVLRKTRRLIFMTRPVEELVSISSPIYIRLQDKVSKARSLMIQNKASRLLACNQDDRLVGIVTSHDLRVPFNSPAEAIHFLSRAPIKEELGSLPVERFVNKEIKTVKEGTSVRSIVGIMLRDDVGSVLVVENKTSKPTGLVSIRDILRIISKQGESEKTRVEMTFRQSIGKLNKERVLVRVRDVFDNNRLILKKVKQAKLVLTLLSGRKTKRPLIKFNLKVKTKNDKVFHLEATGWGIAKALEKLIRRLKRKLINNREKIR